MTSVASFFASSKVDSSVTTPDDTEPVLIRYKEWSWDPSVFANKLYMMRVTECKETLADLQRCLVRNQEQEDHISVRMLDDLIALKRVQHDAFLSFIKK